MKIKYSEIEEAFDFVSFGSPFEHQAYLDRETGNFYLHSEYSEMEGFEDLPDDLHESKYLEIPHKNDLGLGIRLVFRFVSSYLPDKYDEVENIFSSRGAYRTFKILLADQGLLEKWYEFERQATKDALIEWCKLEGIDIAE